MNKPTIEDDLPKKLKEEMEKYQKQKAFHLVLDHRCSRDYKTGIYPAVFTYKDLLECLKNLSEEELNQQVEVLPPLPCETGKHLGLEPVITIGVVKNLVYVDGELVTLTKSSQDWQHHPEKVVLVRDFHGWSEDGNDAYRLEKDENGELVFVGLRTGKVKRIGEE